MALNADGTFAIDISERLGDPVRIRVRGTYVRLSSGFLALTVVEATGPSGEAPAPGDLAYAVEVPGFAMFLQPGGADELIPMLVRGACPTQSFDANWAMAQTTEARDASHPDREWFGTFSYQHGATPMASVGDRFNLSALEPLADAARPIEVGGCQDGLLQVLGDGEVVANMWLTDGGAMVESMKQGQRLQTIFAMKQRPAEIADVAGDYAGFVFVDGDDDVLAVSASIDAQGVGVGGPVDPATGQTQSQGMQFQLSRANYPAPGWLLGTIDSPEGPRNLACSSQVGATNVLFCIGQEPYQPSRAITMVMVAH